MHLAVEEEELGERDHQDSTRDDSPLVCVEGARRLDTTGKTIDEVVQLITASGTPDDVRAKVREYVAAGCTRPVLYPLGPDVHLMIDTFAQDSVA